MQKLPFPKRDAFTLASVFLVAPSQRSQSVAAAASFVVEPPKTGAVSIAANFQEQLETRSQVMLCRRNKESHEPEEKTTKKET